MQIGGTIHGFVLTPTIIAGGITGYTLAGGGKTLTVNETTTLSNKANINTANSFSNIAPMTTLAESWLGPSSTTGIYFKSGNVGIGTTGPGAKLDIVAGSTITDLGLKIKQGSATDASFQTLFTVYNNSDVEQMTIRSRGSDGATVIELPAIRTTAARNTNGMTFLTSASAAQFIQAKGVLLGASYGTPTIAAGEIQTAAATNLTFSPAGSAAMTLLATNGNVGIGTTGPTISGTGKLDMNADTFRLRTARTPATAGAAGNAGEICWDTNYIYCCVNTNTWVRTPILTWV